MTTVVNCRASELSKRGYKDFQDWAADPSHLYIARDMTFSVRGATGSKWGNPFSVKKYGLEECLKLYEEHIRGDKALWDALDELTGLSELGCWCKPEMCHGDVLLRLLSEKKEQKRSVTSLQQRIGDKLSALAFPYFFDESIMFTAQLAGGVKAKAVKQLRDSVVFAEDTAIRALDVGDRQFLRAPSALSGPPGDLSRQLLLHVLVPYAQAVANHPLVDQMTLSSLLRLSSKAIPNSGDTSSLAASSSSEVALFNLALSLTNVVLDLAVQCVTYLPEESRSSLVGQISAAHKQYVDDQLSMSSQHHRLQLVTTLQRLPIEAASVSTTAATLPSSQSAKAQGGEEEEEDEAGELFQVLGDFLMKMQAPRPSDIGQAIDATLRLLTAIQTNKVMTCSPCSSLGAGAGGQSQQQGGGKQKQPSSSAVDAAMVANLNMRVRELLEAIPLPSSPGTLSQPVLRDAVRVMLLLFTNDLEALQNCGSQMIASLQAFTATCKTDAKLGKVGS